MTTSPLPINYGPLKIQNLNLKELDLIHREIDDSATGANRSKRFEKSWQIFNHIYSNFYKDQRPGAASQTEKAKIDLIISNDTFQDAFKKSRTFFTSQRSIDLPIYKKPISARTTGASVIDESIQGTTSINILSFQHYIQLMYELRNRIIHSDYRENDITLEKYLYFSDSFVDYIKLLLNEYIDTRTSSSQ